MLVMFRFFLFALVVCIPMHLFAQEDYVTRRDGFLLIWESIKRPASATLHYHYADVPDDARGHDAISYAANRGILDDEEEYFYPDNPLLLRDAVLWIFRTRNIAEVPDMDEENLPELLARYPIVSQEQDLESRILIADLVMMMRELDELLVKEVHEVSFYGEAFHGNGTAFGETFNMYDFTAAHRTYPHNTLVRVKNVANGESVVVRINDRGPYHPGRDMDLSEAAFTEIAGRSGGIANATFERLGDAELVDRCATTKRRYQKRITRDVLFVRGVPHTFTNAETLTLQSVTPFVVLGVTFPDGVFLRVQDFVLPDEKYHFTPDLVGRYEFTIGDTLGHVRNMRMDVAECS